MKRLLCTLCWLTAASAWAQQLPMKLWYNEPARHFEESLPLGNGRLGALVYGAPDDDVVQLNDITLWSGTPVDTLEDAGASAWIPRIRQALFREDYRAADSLQLHVQGHNSSYYMPLATLHIVDNQALGAVEPGSYHRELDVDSARARVIYKRGGVTFQRDYLASAPDSLIAIHLSASQPGRLDVGLRLTSLLPHRVKAQGGQLTLTGHATGAETESMHFCSILRVDHDGGTVTATDTTLHIAGASTATLYFVNATSFNGFRHHPVREGAPYLERAMQQAWHTVNCTFEDVMKRHLADYRHYYARVAMRLGAVKEQRQQLSEALSVTTDSLVRAYNTGHADRDRYLETLYFQFGRYLLIASSRTEGVPANLQGLWNPHLKAPWRGNYTININLEENYWPAFVANLAEMAQPLDGFVTALAWNGHHTARNYYGARRGWSAGHNSDVWAMANPVGEKREKPEWANWPMGGAWLVETLWERYLFTQDADYLRQVAYPLMRGAAEFCLDWLVENPNNRAELITAPSTSPENEYVTDAGYHGMTCYGSTADMAIVRELFINTIAAATQLGYAHAASSMDSAEKNQDAALIASLEDALQRLHPYTIGHEGDLNEWYHDWRDYDPRHRHQSHLIGLYPGHHLTTGAGLPGNPGISGTSGVSGESAAALTTADLLAAAEQTLVQKGDQTTGWSTGWRINLWARLHKGEEAFHIYQKLLNYVPAGPRRHGQGGGTYPNLFDAHPPFQIDGNFGGTAGVCEMLIQSDLYTGIHLLPALPAAWASGEVHGLCARGGYEVSMQWHQGRVRWATVKARRSGHVTLTVNGRTRTFYIKEGQTKRIHG